jgi:uncharacterized membrane protein
MNIKTINILSYLILILALLGFIDATYLTVEFFSGGNVVCGLIEGCEQVLSSDYSSMFGIPLSLIGVIYYVTISIFAFILSINKNVNILKIILIVTFLGFIASVYFVYLQLFVINAICIYCITSALITTVLLILSALLYKQRKLFHQN